MKQFTLLLFTVLASTSFILGQDTAEESMPNSGVKEKIENTKNKDHLVIDLISYDHWIQNVDGLETKWFSRGFGAYVMYDIQFGKSNFSFAPGIGFNTSNVFTNMTFDDSVDSLGTVFVPISDYKQHKIQLSYIDIPLEFRLRTKPNQKSQSFKLGIGLKGGIKINALTKLVYKTANDERKIVKNKNFKDLSTFRFGPTFRIGYGNFNFFAYYGVMGLFKNNEGPKVNPLSIGFSLTGF